MAAAADFAGSIKYILASMDAELDLFERDHVSNETANEKLQEFVVQIMYVSNRFDKNRFSQPALYDLVERINSFVRSNTSSFRSSYAELKPLIQKVSRTIDPADVGRFFDEKVKTVEGDSRLETLMPAEVITPFFDENGFITIQKGEVKTGLPRLVSGHIVISGRIISDGLGDFFNIKTLIDIVLKNYPGQALVVVLHLSQKYYQKYKEIFTFPPQITIYLLLQKEFKSAEEIRTVRDLINDKRHKLSLPPSLRGEYERASSSIEYYTADFLPYIDPSPEYIIGEPGASDSLTSEENTGLLIPSIDVSASRILSAIKCAWLKKELDALYDPLKSDLFMQYMQNLAPVVIQEGFILAAIENTRRKEGNLIVVSNTDLLDTRRYTEVIGILCERGYGKYIIKKPSGEEKTVVLGEGARSIIVLDPFPLSHEDFIIIMANNTSPIIGCTGDQTLAESILFHSYNKAIPFYQICVHKEEFWSDFIAFSSIELGEEHPFVDYLRILQAIQNLSLSRKEVDAYRLKLIELIKNPLIKTGASKINEVILEKKNGPKNMLKYLEDKLKA